MPTLTAQLASRGTDPIVQKVAHSISIAEAMNEPLWIGDKNHRTLYVNPVYEKVSGYSLQECLGKPSDFCFDEESKRRIAQHHLLRKKNMASQYEATMISKTGDRIPLLISGAPTSEGGTIGIFINLTKVKEMARQEKVGKLILQHSSEAIVVLDKDRKVKIWSKGAEKIFGWREEEILNKSIDAVIPRNLARPNKRFIDEVEEKIHIKNIETKRLAKSGVLLDVSVSVTKVVDDGGHFIGYLVIYNDITQQKKVNSELQKRFETIQDAYKELGLKRRQFDYMNAIVESASSMDSLATLENLIVSAICLLTKCDAAVLRNFQEKNKVLKLKACFGVDQKWWTKSQIGFENSIAEEAYKNKRAIIIDDIDSYPKHQGIRLLKSHKFKTLILLPLLIGKKFLGSISLYTSDPAKFRMIETDFLENMGKQCALALFAKMNTKA